MSYRRSYAGGGELWRSVGSSGRSSGLLVAALILALLLTSCGGGDGGKKGGGGKEGQGGTQGGGTKAQEPPITDVQEIVSAPDKPSLAGRRVDLKDAKVLQVANRRSAFVGPSEEERLFVLQQPKPPKQGGTTGAEQTQPQKDSTQPKRQLQEGQTAQVRGLIRAAPKSYDEALRKYGMSEEQYALVKDQEIFVLAVRLRPNEGS